ncbi:hypothetical protein BXY64_2015, partial [Marinifilum flexuosum]
PLFGIILRRKFNSLNNVLLILSNERIKHFYVVPNYKKYEHEMDKFYNDSLYFFVNWLQ